MRALTIILASLAFAVPTSGSASEAFISQMDGAMRLIGNVQSTVRDAVSAAKIASPLKLSSLPSAAMTSAPNTNMSLIAQSGTNNLASVAQTGGNNMSRIVQNGTGNQAIVSQRR